MCLDNNMGHFDGNFFVMLCSNTLMLLEITKWLPVANELTAFDALAVFEYVDGHRLFFSESL